MAKGIKVEDAAKAMKLRQTGRANAPKCGECPYWAKGWCRISAKWVAAWAEMCEYGRRRRASDAVAICRGRKEKVPVVRIRAVPLRSAAVNAAKASKTARCSSPRHCPSIVAYFESFNHQ